MTDEANIGTQGAITGEPAGAAVGSGMSDEQLLKAIESRSEPQQGSAQPSDDEAAFLKRLESIDPEKLPPSVRARLEAPFLQNYTRKYQDIAEKQNQILGLVTSKLSQAGVQPTQDELASLRQQVRDGNFDLIDQFVEKTIAERIGPVQQQVALRTALEEAERLNPLVKERQTEIGQFLQAEPALAEMARANNFRNAPFVLAGIAYQMEAQSLRDRVKQMETQQLDIAKRAVEAYKRQVRGLPPTTSHAGSTPSKAGGTAEGAMSFKDAAYAAFSEMGIDPGPYFRR